ncbi:MAG: hypothetical protein BWY77_00638 [bacterium ADurb.Bin431]|nr:MAG: hypothetical protein BWY77_00638 [bacterium ADurb.Bin431]
MDDEVGGHHNQDRAKVDPASQRTEQLLLGSAFLGAHDKNAGDGEQGADGSDHHRGDDRLELQAGIAQKGGCAQGGGGQDRARIGFVEVSAHAGDVADIVADVVGDGGRIARIILRDVGFDLADQVGPDIRRLGVDAAADAGEEGLGRGAHAESQHGGGDQDQIMAVTTLDGIDMAQDEKPERNVEQGQTDDHQPHHRTAAEGDAQAAVQGLACGFSRARRGVGGGLHAEKAGKT